MERPTRVHPTPNPSHSLPLISFSEIFKSATPQAGALKRKLFIIVSSDKGLCGGIHSALTKTTRKHLVGPEATADPDSPIVIVGDKAKAQLSRHFAKNFILTVNQVGKDVPTFADAAGVTDLIAQSGVQYDSVRLSKSCRRVEAHSLLGGCGVQQVCFCTCV